MRKLLFFDIDGTLATPGALPSKAVTEAIRRARRNGHIALLSTGRTVRTVPEAVREIGFDGGIYSAGGLVEADGHILADRPMEAAMTERIIASMEREKLNYTLECASGNFQNGALPSLAFGLAKGSSELQRIINGAGWRPMKEFQGEPVYKVSFRALGRGQFERLRQELGEDVNIVCFENMSPGMLVIAGEASDRRVNKGVALEELCRYFGADASDAVAFGDSMNDAEILRAAGLGVAMGNADAAVKALADDVCESCEEDGVAKALARLGLLE